jgi:hypothetical protein
MPTAESHKIAVGAVTLRRSHSHAPALDVLDLVMTYRHHRGYDFGDLALPPAPFALVVAEAFDRGMTVNEWAKWTVPPADPALIAAIQAVCGGPRCGRSSWTGTAWGKADAVRAPILVRAAIMRRRLLIYKRTIN